MFFMLQKGVSKKKLMPDLHLMMERGKILGKSFNDLMLRHHTALGCSSHDVHLSYISPRDYEFSCSGSPERRSYTPFHVSKRKGSYVGNQYKRRSQHIPHMSQYWPCRLEDDVVAVSSVKVLRRGRRDKVHAEEEAPPTQQVMITKTESLFPLRHGDEESHVDKAAEEFIQRFYRELMLQKWTAAREASDWYG